MSDAKGMFGPVLRLGRARLQANKAEMAEIQRRADEAEARLNEPLTRREVVQALNEIADEAGRGGFLGEAFAKLAAVLS